MRLPAFALIVGLIFVAACGGDDPTPSGPGSTVGPMTAGINGTQWTASTASAVTAGTGLLVINGTRLTTPNYTLSFTLSNIGSVGVYALGVGVNMFGGTVVASSPTLGGWSTPLSGSAGEINVTTLTASRIAGTFAFVATPQSGATGNLTVTSGSFDVPITGILGAVPANAGNKVSATIGGVAFNAAAATGLVNSGSSPSFSIAALNLDRNMSIALANVSAAGTYALSAVTPVRSIQISGIPGSAAATWGSQLTGGSGSVTITTFSASRVIGTFTGTLVPLAGGATGNLAVTGTFDMGRP